MRLTLSPLKAFLRCTRDAAERRCETWVVQNSRGTHECAVANRGCRGVEPLAAQALRRTHGAAGSPASVHAHAAATHARALPPSLLGGLCSRCARAPSRSLARVQARALRPGHGTHYKLTAVERCVCAPLHMHTLPLHTDTRRAGSRTQDGRAACLMYDVIK